MGYMDCEYCGKMFTGILWQTRKSEHKATCPEKRYLGGELTMKSLETPEDWEEFIYGDD